MFSGFHYILVGDLFSFLCLFFYISLLPNWFWHFTIALWRWMAVLLHTVNSDGNRESPVALGSALLWKLYMFLNIHWMIMWICASNVIFWEDFKVTCDYDNWFYCDIWTSTAISTKLGHVTRFFICKNYINCFVVFQNDILCYKVIIPFILFFSKNKNYTFHSFFLCRSIIL